MAVYVTSIRVAESETDVLPDWPASADEPATPSRPAELGDLPQQTYNQPASSVGINLDGSTSYPAPENDALNGVTGAVQVNWSLKRS
jgi:hypothetical protein